MAGGLVVAFLQDDTLFDGFDLSTVVLQDLLFEDLKNLCGNCLVVVCLHLLGHFRDDARREIPF